MSDLASGEKPAEEAQAPSSPHEPANPAAAAADDARPASPISDGEGEHWEQAAEQPEDLQTVNIVPQQQTENKDTPKEHSALAAAGEASELVLTEDGTMHDEAPRDITPARALPATILSPVISPTPQTDLDAPISPESPEFALVAALKAQLQAVEEQRDQLNTKLVRSLERCADLEDEVFHAQDDAKKKGEKITTLEEERKEHLQALDTGLLIEEANVKNEMQRLASSLAEAQGKRELAEEGKRTVESEVDDLAASLFQQANSMVAMERLARSRAETQLKEAEDNLSVAESVVREMQQAMQDLHHASKARGLTSSASTNSLLGQANVPRPLRTAHLPYDEFHLFLNHVRSLRPFTAASTTSPLPPPGLSSLLSQPFVSRLLTEDHDPSLRLDVAPGVGWLSRKGLTSAIVEGLLVVEPVSIATVFAQRPDTDIVCALTGKLIIPAAAPVNKGYSFGGEGTLALAAAGVPAIAPPASAAVAAPTAAAAPPPLPPRSRLRPSHSTQVSRSASPDPSMVPLPPSPVVPDSQPSAPPAPPSTVFVFRIAPPSHASAAEAKKSTLYPVEAGWSLDRLRATCELWRFVRTGIVQPVWAYEDGTDRPPPPPVSSVANAELVSGRSIVKPQLPPRKKSWGLSSWGLGRSSESAAPVSTSTIPQSQAPRRLPPPLTTPAAPTANVEVSEATVPAEEEKEVAGDNAETAPEAVAEKEEMADGEEDKKKGDLVERAVEKGEFTAPAVEPQQAVEKKVDPREWEASAWRELTQMRERLFWARVGEEQSI